jgi:DNA-binding MarR family transcriptional regulator
VELNDLRTLRILEQVDNDHSPSQRALARELNISVGLVNSFIKRLAVKGYVKVTTIPRNRMRYILTPTGLAEKTRLTYDYILFSYHFYKQARRKLALLFSELERQNVRRIVFFGATDLAEIAYLSLQDTQIELAAVVDDRNGRQKILGHPVTPISQLGRIPCDRILVTDDRTRDQVKKKMSACRIPREKISWMT